MARTFAGEEQYRVVVLYGDDSTETFGPYPAVTTARTQATRVFTEHERSLTNYHRLAERVGFEPVARFAEPVRTRIERGIVEWTLVQVDWA